jgi:hypothetical protein
VSFLQKPLTPSFRRKPESRIAQKNWIPGRALFARNDDFLLLSRVLQEAQVLQKSEENEQRPSVWFSCLRNLIQVIPTSWGGRVKLLLNDLLRPFPF